MTYVIRSWRELQKAELIGGEDFFVDGGGYFFGDFLLSVSHLTSAGTPKSFDVPRYLRLRSVLAFDNFIGQSQPYTHD